jgi:tetratricopeptide (TPR) repeat protein
LGLAVLLALCATGWLNLAQTVPAAQTDGDVPANPLPSSDRPPPSASRTNFHEFAATGLLEGQALENRGHVEEAANLYGRIVAAGDQIGGLAEKEMALALKKLMEIRGHLAAVAQERENYYEADRQIRRVLQLRPQDAKFLQLKTKNNGMIIDKYASYSTADLKRMAEEQARWAAANPARAANSLLMDARFLYETGRLEEAEAKLKFALQRVPGYPSALYYQVMVAARKYAQAERARSLPANKMVLQIEPAGGRE